MGEGRIGHLVAGVGAVLIFVFLFVDWFGAGGESRDAWRIFSAADIALCVFAVATLTVAVLGVVGPPGGSRFSPARAELLLGTVASVLTLVFMVEYTSGFGIHLKAGGPLTLFAALVVVAGAILALYPGALRRVLVSQTVDAPPPAPRPDAPTPPPA